MFFLLVFGSILQKCPSRTSGGFSEASWLLHAALERLSKALESNFWFHLLMLWEGGGFLHICRAFLKPLEAMCRITSVFRVDFDLLGASFEKQYNYEYHHNSLLEVQLVLQKRRPSLQILSHLNISGISPGSRDVCSCILIVSFFK